MEIRNQKITRDILTSLSREELDKIVSGKNIDVPLDLSETDSIVQALWVLRTAKDSLNLDSLTISEISYLSYKITEIDIKEDTIRKAFARAGKRVKLIKENGNYGITLDGRKYLDSCFDTFKNTAIIDLEKRLKELIKKELSKNFGLNWFDDKKVVPEHISGKAKKNAEKNRIHDKNNSYTEMTFGNCCEIIRLHKDHFSPIFTNGGHGFGSWIEIDGALSTLSRVRNTQEMHSSNAEHKIEDKKLSGIYLEKFHKIL